MSIVRTFKQAIEGTLVLLEGAWFIKKECSQLVIIVEEGNSGKGPLLVDFVVCPNSHMFVSIKHE